jgi:hypothetical protein
MSTARTKKNSNLSVGTRINLFDNSPSMVYDFDKLFPECPLPERFARHAECTIEHLLPNNCRVITIGDESIIHKMFSDTLYGVDRDKFHYDETEKELESINGVTL